MGVVLFKYEVEYKDGSIEVREFMAQDKLDAYAHMDYATEHDDRVVNVKLLPFDYEEEN